MALNGHALLKKYVERVELYLFRMCPTCISQGLDAIHVEIHVS